MILPLDGLSDIHQHLAIMNNEMARKAVYAYLALIENPPGNDAEALEALELALDQLALSYHFCTYEFEDGHPDPPDRDYPHFRRLAVQHFPNFGYYNVPSVITDKIMQAEMYVGDAIDDVADIAGDLKQVAWALENTSENDAIWHFRFGYDSHWGTHLRDLQRYVHAFRNGL